MYVHAYVCVWYIGVCVCGGGGGLVCAYNNVCHHVIILLNHSFSTSECFSTYTCIM